MTAPTHVAFAVALGLISGSPQWTVKFLAGGALLPDIDHPQSAIGRICFFLSYPLNRWFGHRRHIHSLVLWAPFTVLGFIFWSPLGWIGLGAISHCVIDSLNTSGVALGLPITEKIFVLASKKYRISTASRGEFILMIFLGMVAWSGGYIGSMGGFRGLLSAFLGSYDMARGHFEAEGLNVCYLKGTLRLPDGTLKKSRWQIIGTEGEGMAIKESKELLHIPKNGKFLKVKLETTKDKWQSITLDKPSLLKEGTVYFLVGQKWRMGCAGDMVFGYVLHDGNIVLE